MHTYSRAIKKGATQANTLSRWSRSREKRHCLWTLKSDCSIPGQSGHGMKEMKARPCWGCRSARRPDPALPAALLAYGGTHTVTAGRRPPAVSPGSPPGRSGMAGWPGSAHPLREQRGLGRLGLSEQLCPRHRDEVSPVHSALITDTNLLARYTKSFRCGT